MRYKDSFPADNKEKEGESQMKLNAVEVDKRIFYIENLFMDALDKAMKGDIIEIENRTDEILNPLINHTGGTDGQTIINR